MFRFRSAEPTASTESVFIGPEAISDVMLSSMMFESADAEVFKAMSDSMCAMYQVVSCGDMEIAREGLGDMAKSAWEFFKSIIKKIASFIKNAFNYMMSYILDFEKFIDQYKDNLNNFKEFEISGYTYTIDTEPIDNAGISKIVDQYNSNVDKVKKMELVDVQKLISQELGKESIGELRAKLCGKSGIIKPDKFVREMEKKFRNGKGSKGTVKVNSALVSSFIDEFKKYKELLDSVKEDGYNVQGVLNDMADFFHGMPTYEYRDSDNKRIKQYKISADGKKGEFKAEESGEESHSTDYYKKLTTYYNFCYRMCRDIAGIYSKAYTVKVAALKEAVGFYKTVIRKALSPFADKVKDKITPSKEAVGIEPMMESESLINLYTDGVDDYSHRFMEVIHEAEIAEWDKHFREYVNEIDVLAEGYRRGYILMEDVEVKEKNDGPEGKGDSIFKKIIEFIRTLFAKFKDKATNLFNSNKEWFDKYSHKIENLTDDAYANLKLTLIDYELVKKYTMPPETPVDAATVSAEKEITIEELAKKMYPQVVKLSASKDIVEGAKIWFRGKSNKVKVYSDLASVKGRVHDMMTYCNEYLSHVDEIKEEIDKLTTAMEKAEEEYDKAVNESSSFVLAEGCVAEETGLAWLPWLDKNGEAHFIVTEADGQSSVKSGQEADNEKDKPEPQGVDKKDGKDDNAPKTDANDEAKKKEEEEKKKAKEKNVRSKSTEKNKCQIRVKVATAMLTIAEERYVQYIKTLRGVASVAHIAADKAENPDKAKK